MKKKWLLLMILVCLVWHIPAGAKTLTLVMDDRYWYPFTYLEESKAKGMHVDIIKDALKNLGYEILIKPLPRKRCFLGVEGKNIDGMISVAFQKELSRIFLFPSDAEIESESKWRIMQVDHMVITDIDNDYEFLGDIKSLPTPVRVPRGESLNIDLMKAGLFIEEVREDRQNFGKLIRDKKGSIITTSIIAEIMDQVKEFRGKFVIQAIPIASQSYFLAFSFQSQLTDEERKKIWEEIARLRDDYVYMLQLFARY